jgi:xylulokinase
VVDHVLTGLVTPDGGDAPQGADDGHGGFDRLGDALAAVAPGSDGVLFLPWLAGAMAPVAAPAMRGGFVNVSLATGRNHLVRAAVEGTAHNVRWLLDAVEGLTGRPMDPVVLGGGAARSMPWAQVFADVTGRPVRVLAWPELAAARAVALTAMMGPARAGADSDGVVVRTAGEVEPRDAHRAMYDDHQRRFQEAFVALRSLSEGV